MIKNKIPIKKIKAYNKINKDMRKDNLQSAYNGMVPGIN